jgi:hypothetical protein
MSIIPPSERQEDHEFKASLDKVTETLAQKQNSNKRTGVMAQVLEHLLSKGKTHSTTKTKKQLQSLCAEREHHLERQNFLTQ